MNSDFTQSRSDDSRFSATGRRREPMICHHLTTPLQERDIRELRAGDSVLLDGTIFTARDAAHQRLAQGEAPPVSLNQAVIYHCGPVAVKTTTDKWLVVAAGPTTSQREEPYMAEIITRFNLRLIIGKGGMGEKTLRACRESGCAYLHAVGGAARLLAQTVREVENVFWPEAGLPEAIWQLSVVRFPAVVTMDSHGRSIHETVRRRSRARLRELLRTA